MLLVPVVAFTAQHYIYRTLRVPAILSNLYCNPSLYNDLTLRQVFIYRKSCICTVIPRWQSRKTFQVHVKYISL